jgi:hypothetical protein
VSDHSCPSELELDRALTSEDAAIAAHVAGCAECAAHWAATADALALARDLPVELPPVAHREDLRTEILAAADLRPRRTRRRRWLAPRLGLAAAAAAAALLVFRSSSPTPAPLQPPPQMKLATAPAPSNHGTVHAHAGATYMLAADTPDEIVRLRDGTIDVDVQPLAPGERFRVVVGADEVEVRGTSFEVVAAADRLVAVHVIHGRVEVRHGGAAPVVLAPGQAWQAMETAVTSPLPPSPSPAAPRPRRIAAKRAAPEPPPPEAPRSDPQEAAFVVGWEAMRDNDFHTAIAAFAKVVALDPVGDLAEDAAFWRGVSLARLRRSAEAIAALRDFTEQYPSRTRAGEASAMLGWLLLDAKELAEARRRFDAAAADPSPLVQKRAREGLEALAR